MTGGESHGRVLGIDLGERRIGIAIGDLATRTSMPLTTISRARTVDEDVRLLLRLAAEHQATSLVVGLPLNTDGSEGPQAARTREWAAVVAESAGLPLRFRDERLSSVRAEQRVGNPARGKSGGPPSASALNAHRARIDREAAALILQDDFDATGEPAGESPSGQVPPAERGAE